MLSAPRGEVEGEEEDGLVLEELMVSEILAHEGGLREGEVGKEREEWWRKLEKLVWREVMAWWRRWRGGGGDDDDGPCEVWGGGGVLGLKKFMVLLGSNWD